MIPALIRWSLANRFLVLCAALVVAGLGVRAVRETPVDAIPDLSENQVIVYADWAGRSPREVEDQVTFPLSSGLRGLAGVRGVRATSMFGFSVITAIFEDTVDNYFARTRVLERLSQLAGQLPTGVVPQMGPDATGLGWVFQYHLAVDPTRAPVWAALKARAAGAPTMIPATAAAVGSTAQNTLPAATAPATGRVT